MTRRGCSCCKGCRQDLVSFNGSYHTATDCRTFHERDFFGITEEVTIKTYELNSDGSFVDSQNPDVVIHEFDHDSFHQEWETKSQEGQVRAGLRSDDYKSYLDDRYYIENEDGVRTHFVSRRSVLSYTKAHKEESVLRFDMRDAYDMGVENEHGFKRIKNIQLGGARLPQSLSDEGDPYSNFTEVESKYDDPERGKIGDGSFEVSFVAYLDIEGDLEIGGFTASEDIPDTAGEFSSLHASAPVTLNPNEAFEEDEYYEGRPTTPKGPRRGGDIVEMELDGPADGDLYLTLTPGDNEENCSFYFGGDVVVELQNHRITPQYNAEALLAAEYEESWDESVSPFPWSREQGYNEYYDRYYRGTTEFALHPRRFDNPYEKPSNWRTKGWKRTGLNSYRSGKPYKNSTQVSLGNLVEEDFFSTLESDLVFGDRDNKLEIDLIDPETGEVVFSQEYTRITRSLSEVGRPLFTTRRGIECVRRHALEGLTGGGDSQGFLSGKIEGDFDHSKHFPERHVLESIFEDGEVVQADDLSGFNTYYDIHGIGDRFLGEFAGWPGHQDEYLQQGLLHNRSGIYKVSSDGSIKVLSNGVNVYEDIPVKSTGLIVVPIDNAVFSNLRYAEFDGESLVYKGEHTDVITNRGRVFDSDSILGPEGYQRWTDLRYADDVEDHLVLSSGSFGEFIAADVTRDGMLSQDIGLSIGNPSSKSYTSVLSQTEEELLRYAFSRSVASQFERYANWVYDPYQTNEFFSPVDTTNFSQTVSCSDEAASKLIELNANWTDDRKQLFKDKVEAFLAGERTDPPYAGSTAYETLRSSTKHLANRVSSTLPDLRLVDRFGGTLYATGSPVMMLRIRDSHIEHGNVSSLNGYGLSYGSSSYYTYKPLSYPDSISEREKFLGLLVEFRISSDDCIPQMITSGGIHDTEVKSTEDDARCQTGECDDFPSGSILNYDIPVVSGPVEFTSDWSEQYSSCEARFDARLTYWLEENELGDVMYSTGRREQGSIYYPGNGESINSGDTDRKFHPFRSLVYNEYAYSPGRVNDNYPVAFQLDFREPNKGYPYWSTGYFSVPIMLNEDIELKEYYDPYPWRTVGGGAVEYTHRFDTSLDASVDVTQITEGIGGDCVTEYTVQYVGLNDPTGKWGFKQAVGQEIQEVDLAEECAIDTEFFPSKYISVATGQSPAASRKVLLPELLRQTDIIASATQETMSGNVPLGVSVSIQATKGEEDEKDSLQITADLTSLYWINQDHRFTFPVLWEDISTPIHEPEGLDRSSSIEVGINRKHFEAFTASNQEHLLDYLTPAFDTPPVYSTELLDLEGAYGWTTGETELLSEEIRGEYFGGRDVYGPWTLGEEIETQWSITNFEESVRGFTYFLSLNDNVYERTIRTLTWDVELDDPLDPLHPPELELIGSEAVVSVLGSHRSSVKGLDITTDRYDRYYDSQGGFLSYQTWFDGEHLSRTVVDTVDLGFSSSPFETTGVDTDGISIKIKPREF